MDEPCAIEAVRVRNSFYKDSYKFMLLALLISTGFTILLVIANLYVRYDTPAPVYFATNQDGSLKTWVPLNIPYLSDSDVIAFVTNTVKATFASDFLNYRNTLQNVRTHYTPEGYQSFIDALTQSNNLNAVLSQKFSVSVNVVGDPVILQQGVLPATNTYAWRIQIPLDLHYVSSEQEKLQPVNATITVTRVSSLLNEQSIAIASLILSDRVSS